MRVVNTYKKQSGRIKTTEAGLIVRCNDEGLTLFNLPSEKVLGRKILDVADWSARSARELKSLISRGVREGKRQKRYIMEYVREGHRQIVELSGLPVFGDLGASFIEFSLKDLTKRMQRGREDLERRVRTRDFRKRCDSSQVYSV